MSDGGGEVESAQSDFATRVRWVRGWQSVFFSLDCAVMAVSLVLYLCLIRAVARTNGRKETPLYLFLLLHFAASLVEDGLIVHQFVLTHHHTEHTESLCRLFTFVTYGNKILQPTVALAMLYYTWLQVELKRTSVEAKAKQYFPLVVLAILVAELFLAIWPTVNVSGTRSGRHCYRIDDSYAKERLHGWFYLVLLPYFVPLAVSLFPVIRLSLKLYRRNRTMLESEVASVKTTLSVVVGYFFFHLLYYSLMLGRETEAMVLDRSRWRKLLGLHVWYITRPMFALIGYGWNIVVPLAPFSFDPDFQAVFPGTWINRHKIAAKDYETRNSICMSDAGSMTRSASVMKEDGEDSKAGSLDRNRNSFENPLAPTDATTAAGFGGDPEAAEYNRPSVL